MSVLDIRIAGDPVLKTVCDPVGRIDKKIRRTLKDMADTLYASKNGIGLAAPQVGITKRMVVIDLQEPGHHQEGRFPDRRGGLPLRAEFRRRRGTGRVCGM